MALPDIRSKSPNRLRSSDGIAAGSPPQSPRIGIHNPNSLHPTSTIIGLGTIGLGDRCRKERKLLHKQNFTKWKEDKQKEEYQRRLSDNANSPKKPKTPREEYVAKKQEHMIRVDKLMDAQAESARRFRENTLNVKSLVQKAKQEDREFCRDYIAEAKEEEARKYARSHKTEREKAHEAELAAKQQAIKEKFAEEAAIFNELCLAEEEERRARIDFDRTLSMTIDKMAHEAHQHVLDEKQSIVKRCREQLAQKKKLRVGMEKDRDQELRSFVKSTRLEIQDKVENAKNKMLEQRMTNAEQMRDHKNKTLPSSAGASSPSGQRSNSITKALIPTMPGSDREKLESRRQQRDEHKQLIESSTSARREHAASIRQERSSHLDIAGKDKEAEEQYRKELHDYVREQKMVSASAIAAFQESKIATIRSSKPHREGSPSGHAAAQPAHETEAQ